MAACPGGVLLLRTSLTVADLGFLVLLTSLRCRVFSLPYQVIAAGWHASSSGTSTLQKSMQVVPHQIGDGIWEGRFG